MCGFHHCISRLLHFLKPMSVLFLFSHRGGLFAVKKDENSLVLTAPIRFLSFLTLWTTFLSFKFFLIWFQPFLPLRLSCGMLTLSLPFRCLCSHRYCLPISFCLGTLSPGKETNSNGLLYQLCMNDKLQIYIFILVFSFTLWSYLPNCFWLVPAKPEMLCDSSTMLFPITSASCFLHLTMCLHHHCSHLR